jgi:hypothetical protein
MVLCYMLPEAVERWIVCTPLSVNVFVTLSSQQPLEYHCKSLFETPCINSEVTLNRNYPT